MRKKELVEILKKLWRFIWNDNSIWSWIVNVLLAFILIKFLVYPTLSLILSTSHPVVAVVSSSMEHNVGFDVWWANNQEWYLNNDITKEQFSRFPMKNGFNKGDIIVLVGKRPKDIKIGDIIVFKTGKEEPIIHRVVMVSNLSDNSEFIFATKGDNNPGQIKRVYVDETNIHQSQVIGNALFKIPLLGYVKILAVDGSCRLYQFKFCR